MAAEILLAARLWGGGGSGRAGAGDGRRGLRTGGGLAAILSVVAFSVPAIYAVAFGRFDRVFKKTAGEQLEFDLKSVSRAGRRAKSICARYWLVSSAAR